MKSPISISNEIRSLMDEVGRNVLNIWRRQAPDDTGALRNSLTYRIVQTTSDISVVFGYLEYGMFVNIGTGQYADHSSYGLFPFELPSWQPNPGKGRYGIKPRYWMSVSSNRTYFEEELSIIVETVTNNIITTR